MRAAVATRLIGVFISLGLGCATARAVKTELGPDGVYHLTCATTLQVCLNQAEVLCQTH